MTGEEFRARFRLGERLTEGSIVSHRGARESGAPVLLHFLLGSDDETGNSLLERVQAVGPSLRRRILETVEVDGVPVVVTEVLEEFSNLEAWLASAENDQAGAGSEEAKEPGAYTRLFKVSELRLGDPSPEAPKPVVPPAEGTLPATPTEPAPPPEPQTPPVAEVPRTAPDEKKAPGSYTMLFGSGATGDSAPPDEGNPPPTGVKPSAGTGAPPTETPSHPAPPTPPTPPASGASAPGNGDAAATRESPSPAPGPPVKEQKAPGSYTMLFGAGGADNRAPTVPPAAESKPEATPPPPTPPPSADPRPPSPPKPTAPSGTDGGGEPVAPGQGPPAGSGGGATLGFPATASPETPEPTGSSSATDFLGKVEIRSAEPEPSEPVFPRMESPAPPPSPLSPPPPPPPLTVADGAPQPPASAETGTPSMEKKKSGKPGAYTQIFGGMSAGSDRPTPPPQYSPPPPPPPPPSPPRPQAVQPPSPQGSGSPEWQRWKDTPGAAGRHIPSDDYLQRLSGTPDPYQPHPSSPPPPPAEGQKGPAISGPLFSGGGPDQGGPGHYTMVREGLSTDPRLAPAPRGGRPGGSSPAGAPPPQTPSSSKGSRLGTILALAAVLLLIVAVVVVLVVTS